MVGSTMYGGSLLGSHLAVAPSQNASDHQDYEPFLGSGIPGPKPSWVPRLHPGRGPHPKYKSANLLSNEFLMWMYFLDSSFP